MEPGVRDLIPEKDVPACAELLAALPEWFGFPDVNEGYVASLHHLPAFVAEGDNGRVVGFCALQPYGDVSAEIHVMAVRREHHRRGSVVLWWKSVHQHPPRVCSGKVFARGLGRSPTRR